MALSIKTEVDKYIAGLGGIIKSVQEFPARLKTAALGDDIKEFRLLAADANAVRKIRQVRLTVDKLVAGILQFADALEQGSAKTSDALDYVENIVQPRISEITQALQSIAA